MITVAAFGPVTVTGAVPGAKLSVPPPTPGPVPDEPAMISNPGCRPSACAGIVVPRVSVIDAAMKASTPAHSAMLPSVVVIAARTSTLRPALSRMLPLVVVSAALTITSRPQQVWMLPLVALTELLNTTSRSALSRSVVVLGVAVHAIASLTMMSPLPGEVVPVSVSGGVPGVVTVPVALVLIVTLLVTSNADSVAPEMLPFGPMMKSCGSISQVPVVPVGASVETCDESAIETLAAEVSMKPPLPPFGALASRVPVRLSVPFCISPSSRILPPRVSIVCASITPLLLTTVPSSVPAPCVVSRTLPPFALMRPPLRTSAPTVPASTTTESSPSPATSSVIASPPASATVPRRAEIRPSFVTLPPSSAT